MKAKFIIEWLQALDPETHVTAQTNAGEQVYEIIGSISWEDGQAALMLIPEGEVDYRGWYIYQHGSEQPPPPRNPAARPKKRIRLR